MQDNNKAQRHLRALLVVSICHGLIGCVETRLNAKPEAQPGPYETIQLRLDGQTDDWERFGDARPRPGVARIGLTGPSGPMTSPMLTYTVESRCVERDVIPRSSVTVIEREPANSLLAPALLGLVGVIGGATWTGIGIAQYQQLPPPSPAAGDDENRQDQLTQITLPLVTLGVSAVMLGSYFLAGIDGEERTALSPTIGGEDRDIPCAEADPEIILSVTTGLFAQPITGELVTLKQGTLALNPSNVTGVFNRIASIDKACTAHCPTGGERRRAAVLEERARIGELRGSLIKQLDQSLTVVAKQTSLKGTTAGEVARVVRTLRLKAEAQRRIEIDELVGHLRSAGLEAQLEQLTAANNALNEALDRQRAQPEKKAPQYVALRPIDRLVATPWTCLTTEGHNAFNVEFSLAGTSGALSIDPLGRACIDWASYPIAADILRAAQAKAAAAIIAGLSEETLPLIRQAIEGQLPLQTAKLDRGGRASLKSVQAALLAAARVRNPTEADHQPDRLIQHLLNARWLAVKERGTPAELARLLPVSRVVNPAIHKANDDLLWERAKAGPPAGVQLYLDVSPDGPHAAQAAKQLKVAQAKQKRLALSQCLERLKGETLCVDADAGLCAGKCGWNSQCKCCTYSANERRKICENNNAK